MNVCSFPDDEIVHLDRKRRNNRIESDHAAPKRITDSGRGFQTLRTAKATLKGIEAIRMIKRGYVYEPPTIVMAEVRLLAELFDPAA